MNAAESKIAVGDIVERLNPGNRKYVRGRVVRVNTQHDWVRVRVTHCQDRFWRPSMVRVLEIMPREVEGHDQTTGQANSVAYEGREHASPPMEAPSPRVVESRQCHPGAVGEDRGNSQLPAFKRDVALELARRISLPSVVQEIDAALAKIDREDGDLKLLRQIAVLYHKRRNGIVFPQARTPPRAHR